MTRSVIVPSAIGAAAAYAAALEPHFGPGGVDWLVALCLSEPGAMAAEMTLPMKHTTTTAVLMSAGTALASLSCLAKWQAAGRRPRAPTRPLAIKFPLVVLLGSLANASRRLGPRDIAAAYAKAMGAPLPEAEALSAYQTFDLSDLDADLALFSRLEDHAERGAIICAALDLTRSDPEPDAMIAVIGKIAQAMRMTSDEVTRHWAAFREAERPAPAAKSRPAAALGRAALARAAGAARAATSLPFDAALPRLSRSLP